MIVVSKAFLPLNNRFFLGSFFFGLVQDYKDLGAIQQISQHFHKF